ncbi:MAG: ISKra4 family transposase [Chloroflexi bacterium]|nr:ISKra4 family transposase [Chloroflexota bacterium]
MRVKVRVIIEEDGEKGDATPLVEEIACLERASTQLTPETLGLTLTEAKGLLVGIQHLLATAQVAAYLEHHNYCPQCGAAYAIKSRRTLVLRTLFGKLHLPSPQLYTCPCESSLQHQQTSDCERQPDVQENQADSHAKKSFSPLVALLAQRTSPEFAYLQTKWAALMSYGLTSRLLEDVLPLDKAVSTAVLSQQVQQVAHRLESELGEEQPMFIEGCPRDWASLPEPDAPLTVGLDGGYVHGREGDNRKAGSFEVIVGKSMPQEGKAKRFGFVSGYDAKPKRRLFEVLKGQGMQENQQIIFLSDGGDTVRDLPMYLNPQSEHILDWFHAAMRLTVLGQLAKGLPKPTPKPTPMPQMGKPQKLSGPVGVRTQPLDIEEEEDEEQEEEEKYPTPDEIIHQLERVKWYLWHGNVFCALQTLQYLEFDLDVLGEKSREGKKLVKAVWEFDGYIRANRPFIVNYGDRYRNGETISSAFVESTVNEVISKRMVKKQQMRWTKRGAHQLMQVRMQVQNDDLRQTFGRWYSGMKQDKMKGIEERRQAA